MNKNRDDFTSATKNIIAKRSAYICSNPSCRKLTIMPKGNKTICIGVAAHICAAAKGGPRYKSSMTQEERSSIQNGIWLCQTCSNYIDKDEETFTVELLQKWKQEMEYEISYSFNKPVILEKEDKLEYAFELIKFPKKWKEIADKENSFYYSDNPAYTISIIDDKEYGKTEFYSWTVSNPRTYFGTLFIKYNEICLYQTQTVCLDSGLCLTIVPESGYTHLNGNQNDVLKYKYFIKDSKLMILKGFLKDKKGNQDYNNALQNFEEVVTTFDSIEDKEEFDYHYNDYIDSKDLEKYTDEYDYCGYTELEIKKNKIEIALGKFVKNKYYTIKGTISSK